MGSGLVLTNWMNRLKSLCVEAVEEADRDQTGCETIYAAGLSTAQYCGWKSGFSHRGPGG